MSFSDGFPALLSHKDIMFAYASMSIDVQVYEDEIKEKKGACGSSVTTDSFVVELDYRTFPITIKVSLTERFLERGADLDVYDLDDELKKRIKGHDGLVGLSIIPNGKKPFVTVHPLPQE